MTVYVMCCPSAENLPTEDKETIKKLIENKEKLLTEWKKDAIIKKR